MSKEKHFLKILKEHEKKESSKFKNTAYKELEEFCKQISEYLGNSGECKIILGRLVELGQEYRVVITSKKISYTETLFTVYSSLDSTKIHFHGKGQELKNITDLNKTLLAFLDQPGVSSLLNYLKTV